MTGLSVLDASTLADYVVNPAGHPHVDRLLEAGDTTVLVPHLCDVEVASVLRSLVARGVIAPSRATQALGSYEDLPVERVEHLPLLARILALRQNFSAYDATYVALAEVVDAPLHTSDQRLARAVRAYTAVDVRDV